MNSHFPRIITLLRKERGLSQKKAAEALQISQALLSHYEKGIRECGLDFVVRAADFYGVSCDYLLGRTPDRSGAILTMEDIPDPDAAGKENRFRGSLLPTLNKKLIANSLNILYDLLQNCNNKAVTNEISGALSAAVYKAFRILYSANSKNPQGMFAVPERLSKGAADAAQSIAESNAACLMAGEDAGELEGIGKDEPPALSPEQISERYPLFANSLFNLIRNTEARMGVSPQGKKDK